jgi:hypothetical protein
MTQRTAQDVAEEMTKMVSTHAMLKCPSGGNYAWEAGCLTSIIKTIAGNHPEVMATLERELAWHTKQVMCLSGLSK